MKRFLVVILMVAVIKSGVVFGGNCSLVIKKKLKDGDSLSTSSWSYVEAFFPKIGLPTVTVRTPYTENDIQVYFANEEKNVLVINLSMYKALAYRYETPYGNYETLRGEDILRDGNKVEFSVPLEWFPENVTRMSASVEVEGQIYNYYGIFNYAVSTPDTMVVEEYKNIELCLRS